MLIQLVYGSTSDHPMTDAELMEILEKSRKNNQELNVTGMLLYHDNSFIQVLEGEEDVVDELYRKIKMDERHASVVMFFHRKISEREFPEWKMGFVNLRDVDPADVPGYSDYLNQSIHPKKIKPSHAQAFLKAFKRSLR